MAVEMYDPMSSASFYSTYYRNQAGKGVQVYSGTPLLPQQSGAGIGGLFSSLLKAAAPMAKAIGKKALRTGLNMAGEMINGGDGDESDENEGPPTKRQRHYAPSAKRSHPSRQHKKRPKKRSQSGRGLVSGKSKSIF